MNPELDAFLARAKTVIWNDTHPDDRPPSESSIYSEGWSAADFAAERSVQVHVGVDLGTAYTVVVVLDREMQPLAGEYRFAQVIRDGLVIDFYGAINLVQELKARLESRLGFRLTSAATTYPPGVPSGEVRATRHVIEAAGFEFSHMVDEPTAANRVLQVQNGAVVDVGGGTTGLAIIREGKVIYTADEPTGGTHFSLVIAGSQEIEFEAAEALKKDVRQHRRLFPVVRPVMEKVGTIIGRHIASHAVDTIYLVGGTACFRGIDQVVQEVTGIKTIIPGQPLFVTPLGVAMHDLPDA